MVSQHGATSHFSHIIETFLVTPLGVDKEGYQFQHKLCESHDLTLQPVITYIYLCWHMHQAADISNIHS